MRRPETNMPGSNLFPPRTNRARCRFLKGIGRNCLHPCCLGLIFILALVAGCNRQTREATDNAGQRAAQTDARANVDTVAMVGERPLAFEDLRAYLKVRPPVPGEGDMKDVLRQRLDELVADEVLFREAKRLGIDRSPEIERTIRAMLTQRLLYDQVERKIAERNISEEELRAFYDEHSDEFSRPEQLRLGVIFLGVPAGATKEERDVRRRDATEILARALENGRQGFSALVRTHSDPSPHHLPGDTGFFDRSGRPAGLDPVFVEQTFGIEEMGQVYDKLIETGDGFSIVLPLARRPAVTMDFEAVAPEIENRIRQEEIEQARRDYIAGLEQTAGVEIFDDRVTQLAAEVAEKPKAGGPRPVKQGVSSAPPRFPAR